MGHQTNNRRDAADEGGSDSTSGGVVPERPGVDRLLPLGPPDESAKADQQRRLRRIEGQVRGVQQMLEADRYCGEVLDQIAAIQQALRASARELVRMHLDRRLPTEFDDGREARDAVRDEIVALLNKKF